MDNPTTCWKQAGALTAKMFGLLACVCVVVWGALTSGVDTINTPTTAMCFTLLMAMVVAAVTTWWSTTHQAEEPHIAGRGRKMLVALFVSLLALCMCATALTLAHAVTIGTAVAMGWALSMHQTVERLDIPGIMDMAHITHCGKWCFVCDGGSTAHVIWQRELANAMFNVRKDNSVIKMNAHTEPVVMRGDLWVGIRDASTHKVKKVLLEDVCFVPTSTVNLISETEFLDSHVRRFGQKYQDAVPQFVHTATNMFFVSSSGAVLTGERQNNLYTFEIANGQDETEAVDNAHTTTTETADTAGAVAAAIQE